MRTDSEVEAELHLSQRIVLTRWASSVDVFEASYRQDGVTLVFK